MLVVDNSVWLGKELDSSVEQIIGIVRLAGLRGPDGEEFLGCAFGDDGTWLVLQPDNGIGQSATEVAWRAGRMTLDAEGFTLSGTYSLHDAVVEAMKLPCPYYSVGLDQVVANCVVDDASQAKLTLAELLTQDLVTDFEQAAAYTP